jgi:hypothetical protein
LTRTEAIMTTVLGARKVYGSGGETFSLSGERFFLVGATPGDADAPAPIWIAIMEGESLPSRTYDQIAFCDVGHSCTRWRNVDQHIAVSNDDIVEPACGDTLKHRQLVASECAP